MTWCVIVVARGAADTDSSRSGDVSAQVFAVEESADRLVMNREDPGEPTPACGLPVRVLVDQREAVGLGAREMRLAPFARQLLLGAEDGQQAEVGLHHAVLVVLCCRAVTGHRAISVVPQRGL